MNNDNINNEKLSKVLAKASLQISQILANLEFYTGTHVSGIDFKPSVKREIFIANETDPLDTQYQPPFVEIKITMPPSLEE